MLVYRYCSKREINKIFEHHYFDKIGCQRDIDLHVNTHQYKKDVYYMHFYLAEDSLFYSYLSKDYCICTYEIPDDLVNKYLGAGYYPNREGKKIGNDYLLESVLECAIPSQFIYFDYLKKIDVLNESPLYEDYLKGTFPYFLDTYYKKEENCKKLVQGDL